MEELQSTEVLDREILEDARKKALRILKSAEDTINAQNAQWEKKISESIENLIKKYDEQKEVDAQRVMARLPVDILRARIEKIEYHLNSAIEAWYKKLNRTQIVDLLSLELVKRLEQINTQTEFANSVCAVISGINTEEAQLLFKKLKINCNIKENNLTINRFPSIILETDKIRIIASIEQTADFLLQEKRAQLIEALVGQKFMGANNA
ncbi:MAG: hypothetical protein FWB86_12715 [Treponema sp.]|nr:hypothetical protein [Treponema sp.]